VGVSDVWDLPDAYRRVVDVVFAKVREMAAGARAWMGSSEPNSLLHALDKWLWWAGGGRQGTAVVVANPAQVLRLLGLEDASSDGP